MRNLFFFSLIFVTAFSVLLLFHVVSAHVICPDVKKDYCENILKDPPGTMVVSNTPVPCTSNCRTHVDGLSICFNGVTLCFPLVPSPNVANSVTQYNSAVSKACMTSSQSCTVASNGNSAALNLLCVNQAGGSGSANFCHANPPATCKPPVTNGNGCKIQGDKPYDKACVTLEMDCNS